MLTDISLMVEIAINNNKFYEIFLRNVLDSLMPKIPKW